MNLDKRFRNYFSITHLEKETKKNKSMIYRAILKNGYSIFTLEILEYCQPSEVISREQYYLDLLKPEYNILKEAGSRLGSKHSLETRAKFSVLAKARTRTPEQKAQHLEHLERLNSSPEHKERLKNLNLSQAHKEHLKRLNTIQSQQVSVLDSLKNETTVYPSMTKAAQVIGCSKNAISRALSYQEKKGILRLVNKRYVITIFKEGSFYVSEEVTKLKKKSASNRHSKWKFNCLFFY